MRFINALTIGAGTGFHHRLALTDLPLIRADLVDCTRLGPRSIDAIRPPEGIVHLGRKVKEKAVSGSLW